MRQKLLLSLPVITILLFTHNAFAQSLDDDSMVDPIDMSVYKYEGSLQVGAAIPKEDDANTGIFVLGRVIYNLLPNVGIGGTTGWMNYSQEYNGSDYGDIGGIPLLATIILKVPTEAVERVLRDWMPDFNGSRLVLYALGGIGGIYWYYDESNLLKNSGISVDSDFAFAAQIGGGIDYYLTNRMALFVEGSYIFSDYKADVRASGTVVALSADTDAFFIGGGIKSRF